jgi:GNAT superfamily N-acetyltransferase
MSDLVIRRPAPADEAEWRRLWTAYLAFYETSVPEEVYRTTWARLLSEAEGDCHGFLALRDGQPVGLVHYIYHRHNWRVEKVTYLQDLYVDAEARGTGAGRALIEAVYSAADEAGCPSVYWMTQDFNHTARQLYDRIATLTPFIKYQR